MASNRQRKRTNNYLRGILKNLFPDVEIFDDSLGKRYEVNYGIVATVNEMVNMKHLHTAFLDALKNDGWNLAPSYNSMAGEKDGQARIRVDQPSWTIPDGKGDVVMQVGIQ